MEQTNNQNLKTLNQIEREQKQKIVFKPKDDRFFQPFSLILIFIGFLTLAVGLVLNGYSYGSIQLLTQTIGSVPVVVVHASCLKASAGLFFVSAIIFLFCFIIKFIRALIFVKINENVSLKDVDSNLINKFTVRTFIYLFLILSVVTITLIGVNDIAMYNNLFKADSFVLVSRNYWYIASILSVLTACLFVFCLFAEFTGSLKKKLKDYFLKKDDPEILMMVNRHKQENYVRLLMINIVFWAARFTLIFFAIYLLIYGITGLAFHNNQGNLQAFWSAISTSAYISAGWFFITIPFMIYSLALDYRVLNYDAIKENKLKKERARVEKIKMKTLKKEIKHA